MTFIAWCIANWKTIAIGALVIALMWLGYYARGVIADRDEAKAEITQLKKDIALEQERTKQYQAVIVLKDADLAKYQQSLGQIQKAHDVLDTKYTKLWNKYIEATTDLDTEDVVIPQPEPKPVPPVVINGKTVPAVVEKIAAPCYMKSITRDIEVFPSGIPTFGNISAALSRYKGGQSK
jgi:hypothetical protein